MHILLVRHGITRAHSEGRIQPYDEPLSSLGIMQAEAVAKELKRRQDFVVVLTSPLRRARETAEIVSREFRINPVQRQGLAEINYGSAVGMSWKEWAEDNQELIGAMRDPVLGLNYGWSGGESGSEMRDRVLMEFEAIMTEFKDYLETLVIVAHGGSLAWIAAFVFDDPLDRWPNNRGGLANCSISEVNVGRNRIMTMDAWNSVRHLSE